MNWLENMEENWKLVEELHKNTVVSCGKDAQ